MRRLFLLAGLLGCTHSDPFVTEADPLSPLEPGSPRLTYNVFHDSSQVWTPDGNGIVYTFADSGVKGKKECLGIISPASGTRRWSFCDNRSSHLDSIDHYHALAMRDDGQLLFMQAVYPKPRPTFPLGPMASTVLWLADTADLNAHRRPIIRFPHLIGDSIISWMTDAAWIDATTFIAAAYRYINTGYGDDIPAIRWLVEGTVSANDVVLRRIPGTDHAVSWTRAGNGDIIFLRGETWRVHIGAKLILDRTLTDSVIWRVPRTGGTPVAVATAPNRGGQISCAGNDCLFDDRDLVCGTECRQIEGPGIACLVCAVETHNLYYLDLESRQIRRILSVESPTDARVGPQLNRAGTQYAYRRNNNLFFSPFTRP